MAGSRATEGSGDERHSPRLAELEPPRTGHRHRRRRDQPADRRHRGRLSARRPVFTPPKSDDRSTDARIAGAALHLYLATAVAAELRCLSTTCDATWMPPLRLDKLSRGAVSNLRSHRRLPMKTSLLKTVSTFAMAALFAGGLAIGEVAAAAGSGGAGAGSGGHGGAGASGAGGHGASGAGAGGAAGTGSA